MTDVLGVGDGEIAEQAVIARYRLTSEGFGSDGDWATVHEAERALHVAIEAAGVGELDGDEFGDGEAVLYAYGPDADALFGVMAPLLRSVPLRPAQVRLRYGPASDPDAVERVVEL